MMRDIFAEESDDIATKAGVLPGHVAVVMLHTQYLTSVSHSDSSRGSAAATTGRTEYRKACH